MVESRKALNNCYRYVLQMKLFNDNLSEKKLFCCPEHFHTELFQLTNKINVKMLKTF